MRRLSDPKPKAITPEQEQALAGIEQRIIRSQIYQYGVQRMLDDGTFADSLKICALVLAEAADMRRHAYRLRAEILREVDSGPAKPKPAKPKGFRKARSERFHGIRVDPAPAKKKGGPR